MAHFKTFFDNEMLGSWDLRGKDATVTIKEVVAGKVGHGKTATKKPILTLERTEKRLTCNVTNCKAIAGMYGPDTVKWIGKQITLYPTTTQFGSETFDCIRVRPTIPSGKKSEGIEGVERPDGARLPGDAAAEEHPQ